MNDCNVILWGGTGQAKVVADIIGLHRIAIVFDNNKEMASPISEIPIFYQEIGFKTWYEKNKYSGGG